MARKPTARRKEPTLREEIAASGETPVDAVAAEARREREELVYLGREFLTWLVYHAEAEEGRFDGEGDLADFAILLGGRVALRTPAGMVTDLTMKGPAPSSSPDLRYALAGGLAVKEADLRLESGDRGDRAFTFALSAEHFDSKRVKLPALLTDEEDDRADERLALLEELDSSVKLAYRRFLEVRTRPTWARSVVPAMRAWLEEGTRAGE
jgi:hypothetical protein